VRWNLSSSLYSKLTAEHVGERIFKIGRRVARFLSYGAKHWQKVAQNRLIFIHKAVFSDSKSSPKLAIKAPNSGQSQILVHQQLSKVAQSGNRLVHLLQSGLPDFSEVMTQNTAKK